jgi:hypothetical protein
MVVMSINADVNGGECCGEKHLAAQFVLECYVHPEEHPDRELSPLPLSSD